ncbi:MAG: hypothetical protein R6T87_03830 [Marinobacter sp.]
MSALQEHQSQALIRFMNNHGFASRGCIGGLLFRGEFKFEYLVGADVSDIGGHEEAISVDFAEVPDA